METDVCHPMFPICHLGTLCGSSLFDIVAIVLLVLRRPLEDQSGLIQVPVLLITEHQGLQSSLLFLSAEADRASGKLYTANVNVLMWTVFTISP